MKEYLSYPIIPYLSVTREVWAIDEKGRSLRDDKREPYAELFGTFNIVCSYNSLFLIQILSLCIHFLESTIVNSFFSCSLAIRSRANILFKYSLFLRASGRYFSLQFTANPRACSSLVRRGGSDSPHKYGQYLYLYAATGIKYDL